MDPILSDLEKDDLAWATEEEDWLNIEELDLAFLLSLECFDPSKPIDKQEEEKLGDFWDNYGFWRYWQSPLDGLKSPRPSPKWNGITWEELMGDTKISKESPNENK